MAETLTAQQRLAVENRGGKLLVSAAAGSGKTKVLVDRLLGYLTDAKDPANIDDFLIITYTKAAASELRAKIAAKITQWIASDPENRHLQRQMQRLYLTKISTVHAFCSDVLREYAYLLDIPSDFRVADENECYELQTTVLEQILESAYASADALPDFCAFADSQGFGRDDREIPEIILKVYNSARCHLDPAGWLSWCISATDVAQISDAGDTVWGAYLIADLKSYLNMHISALEKCILNASDKDYMEKPVLLLKSTVDQLVQLRECDTWDAILKCKDIDYGRLTFSKKCQNVELSEEIKAVRNACKTGMERKLRVFTDSSTQVLSDLQLSGTAVRGLIYLVKQFEKLYSERKHQRRILDFGDLEHKMLDLLLGKKRTGMTNAAYEIGERFREVMIDEYQDTNAVQDHIFGALTAKRQNCFMVGDVKQSIYQFRLADPEIFIKKFTAYADAENAQPGEGRRVVLSSNFRSASSVINAVNDVFSNCMTEHIGGIDYTEEQMLREGIPHVPNEEPEIELYGICVQQDTYAEEAAFAANRITQLLDGKHMIRNGDQLRPIKPEDIVILLRSPNSVGNEFCYALEKKGIPCVSGGGVDLLQSEEISVLRSFLQIISNPVQDIPLLAVMTSRIFCFTADALAAIRAENKYVTIYEALKQSGDEKVKSFLQLLNGLRLDCQLYSLPQLIQRIFIKTRMDSIFTALPDGAERKENLQTFCQMVADYEANTHKGLDQLLEHLDAMERKGMVHTSDQVNTGAVTIMSIHKSKGLEFPVVFLCGLSRSFNQENAREQVLCDKDLGLGLSCIDMKNRVRYPNIAKRAISRKIQSDSISEEMRVLYVAMTRAKDRLIMTYAAKNLENDLNDIILRSRFSGKVLLTKEVHSPGEWILQTALKRTEAGSLFQLAGNRQETAVSQIPWKICVIESSQAMESIDCAEHEASLVGDEVLIRLRDSLQYHYPHISASNTPSKLTATQLKGRFKDAEAAENTDQTRQKYRAFRKPSFVATQVSGKDIGNAIHAVMQYISYSACTDELSIRKELDRLVDERFISPSHRELANTRKIWSLFSSPLGIRMRTCEEVLREFKFSILDRSEKYAPETIGEEVLLQGVVDCALIEPDGIIVIDFKTDYVTESTLDEVCRQYSPQVKVYAEALGRIFEKPIQNVMLYFFHLDRFVEITV